MPEDKIAAADCRRKAREALVDAAVLSFTGAKLGGPCSPFSDRFTRLFIAELAWSGWPRGRSNRPDVGAIRSAFRRLAAGAA